MGAHACRAQIRAKGPTRSVFQGLGIFLLWATCRIEGAGMAGLELPLTLLKPLWGGGGLPGAPDGSVPAARETRFRSLGWEGSLEEAMATHSSILAWRTPWTEKPGGLQSMGWQSDMTKLLTLGRGPRCPHGALLRPAEAQWSVQPAPGARPAQQTPQKQPALKTVFTRRGSRGQCPLAYWGSSTESVPTS